VGSKQRTAEEDSITMTDSNHSVMLLINQQSDPFETIQDTCLTRGVSEQDNAERALRRSEERFRRLSEALDAELRARTRELEERNAEVLRQSERLGELSRELLQSEDEERRHIARELHDSAGQKLTLLGMNLAQLVQKIERKAPELVSQAGQIQETVQQLHREIRTTSYLLHPPMLDENGLCSAISWYVQGLLERSGLEVRLDIPEQFGRLDRDMELVIFRLVQECLTNIHRHSDSKTASIRMAREFNHITLDIRDQGKGMSPTRLAQIQSGRSGVGIRGMRERLRQFQGTMTIESGSSGTRVFARIPVSKEPSPGSSKLRPCQQPSAA
jgi:two-component system, NarL family, sensor kinase